MNQPTTNPTYEEKLQKLRDAGVIDMELSFGCKIRWIYNNEERLILQHYTSGNNLTLVGNNAGSLIDEEIIVLGHDLTYGRACWWIEENKLSEKLYDNLGIASTVEGHLKRIWKQKHLPLSQQENKSEIVDFIYNLIQGQQ